MGGVCCCGYITVIRFFLAAYSAMAMPMLPNPMYEEKREYKDTNEEECNPQNDFLVVEVEGKRDYA